MIPVLAALAEHYDNWLLSWSRDILGLPVLWLAVLLSTNQRPRRAPSTEGGCCVLEQP